jgi:hypothetical protein
MDCGHAGGNPERCVDHHGVTTSDLQTEKVFFCHISSSGSG